MRVISVRFLSTPIFLLLSAVGFGQAPEPEPEYTMAELLEEQRLISSYLGDADREIQRTVDRVGKDLIEAAKVSLLRSTGKLSGAEELLRGHAQRIELLKEENLLANHTVRRDVLREGYDEQYSVFNDREEDMFALRKDMARKGMLGGDLATQVAVLDILPGILADLMESDPAAAEQLKKLMDELDRAIESGNQMAIASKVSEIESWLESRGMRGRIDDQVDEINRSAGVTGAPQTAGGSFMQRGSGGGMSSVGPETTITLPDGRKQTSQETVTRLPDGNTETRRVIKTLNPDGSIDVVEVLEVRDSNGNLVSTKTDRYKMTADGRRISGRTLIESGNGDVTVIESDGTERRFYGERKELSEYETVYIGGEGQRLTMERELKLVLERDSAGSPQVNEIPGAERTWNLVIEEVPGARKFDDSGMTTRFVFRDRGMKSDFRIKGWEISSPSGQPLADFGGEGEIEYRFTESGSHTLTVRGETGWGNAFNVTVSVQVAL